MQKWSCYQPFSIQQVFAECLLGIVLGLDIDWWRKALLFYCWESKKTKFQVMCSVQKQSKQGE